MLEALLNVMLPVVMVAGVGTVLARYMQIDQDTVARISLYGLSPALALHTLLGTTVAAGDAARLLGAYLLSVAIMALVTWLLTPRQANVTRRSVVVAVTIGNNGNFGLPISLFALGRAGFEASLLIFLASVIVTFTFGSGVYGASGNLRETLAKILRLPVMWCVALALLIRVTEVTLPLGVMRGIELLAQATLPMVLLALGFQIGARGWPRLTSPIVLASTLRLGIGPVVALVAGLLLGLTGVLLQAVVLAAAMPTAVNAYLLAQEYRADVDTVAGTVVITTLFSVLLIAVVVVVLGPLGMPG